MKRFLALLIAVLMVVAMLPAAVLSAAAESFGELEGGQPLPMPGPGADSPEQGPEIDPEHTFAVYDAEGALVSSYATLAEADAALLDGYTLAFLANYDAGDVGYAFGEERAQTAKLTADDDGFISYTIEGNGYTMTSAANVALDFRWASIGDKVTIKNLTVVAQGNAIRVGGDSSADCAVSLTLENCKIYAGNSYYEIDPSKYETEPTFNASAALAIGPGASARVLGATTELVTYSGIAVAVMGANLYVEDGFYYSIVGPAAVAAMQDAVLNIAGGTFVGNQATALAVGVGAIASVHGGTFAVTGDVYNDLENETPVSAIAAMESAKLFVTNANLVVPANAVSSATDASVRETTAIYAVATDDTSDVKVTGVTVMMNSGNEFSNVDPADMLPDLPFVEGFGEPVEEPGTVELPYGKTVAYSAVVTVALDLNLLTMDAALAAGFPLVVTNADGAIVAAWAMTSPEDFAMALLTVPNGGALNLLAPISSNSGFGNLFGALPAIDLTLNGVGEGIAISASGTEYLMAINTAANVTVTNIKLENTDGSFGLLIGAPVVPELTEDMVALYENASVSAGGTFTLGAGSSVVGEFSGVWVAAGATVVVAEGATVTGVVVETAASFVLAGGTISGEEGAFVVLGSTRMFGEAAVTETEAKIDLLAGKVQVDAGITSMITFVDPAYTADITIAEGVTIESLILDDGDAPIASVVTGGNTLAVYDETGALVDYFASLADVFEVIEDGYTVTMTGDHVETNKVDIALGEIAWTLEGNGYALYLLNGGIDFLGTSTSTTMQNMTVYSSTYALQATGNTPSKIFLHDAFLYANGAVSEEFISNSYDSQNAINLATACAELIITGEDSGVFSGSGENLIYNEGFLAIYGGTYTSTYANCIINVRGTVTADEAAPNKLSAATLYLAGGKIVGGLDSTIFVHGGAKMVVTGGDVIAAEFAAPIRFNSEATNAYAWIFGGRFYTDGAESFLAATTPTHNFIRFYGGEFYNSVEDDRITTGTKELTKWTLGGAEYNYGYALAAGYSASNVDDYTASVENGDPAEVAGNVYFKQTVAEDADKLEALGYTEGAYTFVVKASRLVENAPEIGLYDPADLFVATVAAGPYEGTIELQKNVTIEHSVTTCTYTNGPAAVIVLTSAVDAETYYTYQSNGAAGLLCVNGGTFKLENVTLENLAGQTAEIATSAYGETTFIVGESGELSTNSSGILAQKGTKIVVEEGGLVNAKSNALTNANPAANLLRVKGDADVEIYGCVGFYRDGSIGELGYWVAYNYEDGQAEIAPETGKSADLLIAPSAKIAGPNNNQDAQYLIRSRFYTNGTTDYTQLFSVNITIQPGAVLQSNTALMDARCGTQLNIDGVEIYSSNVNEDGTYNEYSSVKGYAFYLHGVGGTFKNIEFYNETTSFAYIASAGSPFSVEKGTLVFEDCVLVTGSNKCIFVVAAPNDTNITINSGHYENKMNGNLILFGAQEDGVADSKGVLTINGGTFLKYYSAGMFKVQGNRQIVINGGDFKSYNGAILGLTWESGQTLAPSIEINGGFFETHSSYMFYAGHDNANIDLTVNDGEFYVTRATDPVKGDARTPTGIFYLDGESTLTVNGGFFETEECDYFNSYLVRMMDKSICHINGGDFYHLSNGGQAILSSESSTININGGYIISNGDFVARTMAGASKSGTTLNPTVTAYSDATLNVNGGVLMLINRTGNYTHPTNAVVSDGGTEQFGHLNINGGILINARDVAFGEDVSSGYGISRQVVLKYHTVGTVVINGGIMVASPAQDYFYFSYGNADVGYSIPATNLGIQKGSAPTIDLGGYSFYYASYAMNTLVAPELEAAMDIELAEDEAGLKFNSKLSSVLYDALQTWAESLAADNGYAAEDYTLTYGTIIAPVDYLILTNGVFTIEAFAAYTEPYKQEARAMFDEMVASGNFTPEEIERMEEELEAYLAELELPYFDCPAEGLTESAENGVAYSATVPVAVEDNEVRLVALPYVIVTLGTDTEAKEDDKAQIYYGSFNSVKSSATLAELAERALYDNTDEVIGAYQYPSILVKDAYNRYTVEEQALLVTYLAHKHSFDYKGVCAECEEDASYPLEDGETAFIYGDYGVTYYYTLSLKAGVSYAIAFNRDVADYVLYDAEGNICTTKKDVFACAADGTYYLVVTCNRIGAAEMTMQHVHQAGYTGYCTVCKEDLSIDIEVEQLFEQPVIKGNNYYYAIDLTAGVSYTVITLNGLATVYDASGNPCPVVDNIFTAGGEAGESVTHYIVVAANYTSNAGTVYVQHVHSFDYTGTCVVDGCGEYIGRTLDQNGRGNLYSNIGGRLEKGDQLFVNITLAEGNQYFFTFTTYIGNFKLYDQDGEVIKTGANYTFTPTYTGSYYLEITAENDVTGYVYFGMTHEHTYDHRGKCAFEHMGAIEECGKTNYKKITDGVPTTGLTLEPGVKYQFALPGTLAGVTYHFEVPEGVVYRLFGNGSTYESAHIKDVSEGGTKLDYTTNNYCDPSSGRTLFIQLENTTEETMTNVSFKVSHIHQLDYTGKCTVSNCAGYNVGGAMTTDTEIEVADYAAGNVYYRNLYMYRNTRYTPVITNAAMTVKIYDKVGTLVYNSEVDGEYFECEDSQTYYVVATMVGDKLEVETPVTVKVASHKHEFDYKGACSDAENGCGYSKLSNMTEMIGAGYIDMKLPYADNYYGVFDVIEGETYQFVFTSAKVSYKIYKADGTECTVTDNKFLCTEGGQYYIVITATDASAGTLNATYSHICVTTDEEVSYMVEDGKLYTHKNCDYCGEIMEKTLVENAVVVTDTASAQAALDNATEGTWIWMEVGNYGTLYIRQSDKSVPVDMNDNWAGGGQNTFFRSFKGVKITGVEGTFVDSFVVEALTYVPGENWHSQADEIEYLRSYIAIEDVLISGIAFNVPVEGSAVNVAHGAVSISGLTIDNCTIEGQGSGNVMYITGASEIKDASGAVILDGKIQNITLSNSVVSGLYQILNINEVENLTVEDNTFEDIADRGILLTPIVEGGEAISAITGTITISDNEATMTAQRFIRMNTLTPVTVVISGNTVVGQPNADDGSIAKLTLAAGSTVTCSENTWNGADDENADTLVIVDIAQPEAGA